MIVSISDQVYIFFCTILCGMAISFLYDIFRIIRKTLKSGRASIYVEDLLFWILSAVIMSVSIYYCNSGELRLYMFLGALLGAVLYELLFSRVIINASLFIINLFFKVFKAVVFVISYPVRLICRTLKEPLKRLGAGIKAAISKARADRRARAMNRVKRSHKSKARNKTRDRRVKKKKTTRQNTTRQNTEAKHQVKTPRQYTKGQNTKTKHRGKTPRTKH